MVGVGFGQQWFYYQTNAVGQWVPGPSPDSLGLLFQDGVISVADGHGKTNQIHQQIGTYTPGVWIPITLDLNSRGVLRVSAPGIIATYATG